MNRPYHLQHLISTQAYAAVTAKSDWWGAWVVFCQYAIFALTFVAVALWTHPISLVLGTLILGGRHLGFFVLTHETGHNTLFKSRWANAFVGDWLMSPMDFNNGRAYMREHLIHHHEVGQESDPDLANYADYPITQARLRRKLLRDITGRTGWRNLRNKLAGLFRLSTLTAEDRAALLRGVAANLLLVTVLIYLGHGWLFCMWIGAVLITGPLIARVRQIAEHGAVPDLASADPLLNTRTVMVNPLERLLLAPHGVNFHIEHHLAASVPIYRLRTLHKTLSEAGYFADTELTRGYLSVLRTVSSVQPA